MSDTQMRITFLVSPERFAAIRRTAKGCRVNRETTHCMSAQSFIQMAIDHQVLTRGGWDTYGEFWIHPRHHGDFTADEALKLLVAETDGREA